jgi:hypothetical protein
MKNVKKLFVAALMVALLGSLAGCFVVDGPYPGHPYRYREPGYRSPDPRGRNDRYDRYQGRGHYDYRYRDWGRD